MCQGIVKNIDILIENGLIVDGRGTKPYYGDIAIERDYISGIGKFDKKDARKVIDATGLMVTPGFIDGHTHSELNLMRNRQQPNAVYQGISSIVTGQCGLGFAPIKDEHIEDALKINSGIFGDHYEYLKPWNSFEEYLRLLDGTAVNACSNVSHNAIRQMACGFRNHPLKDKTLSIAKEALEQSMIEGAVGLSIGLSYYPGGYSDTQELIELCKIVKKYDGLLSVHLRLDDGKNPISPTKEIVKIVENTGVRLNMLHYRTGGCENIETLFEPFSELEKAGSDIHYEYYPYLVGAGLVLALIPDWAQEGNYHDIMSRLTSKKLRRVLLKDMKKRYKYFFAPGQTATISSTKDPYSSNLGKTIDQIAKDNHETFFETVIRLLVENELEVGFVGDEYQSEELKEKLYHDQYRLFLDDRYSIGSDVTPEGIYCHPRVFGSFAKIISQMRDKNVPVEYIIKKLTSIPARLYKIKDRGIISQGMKADICLMDYAKVKDMSTYKEPRAQAEGIITLLVNGLPVMQNRSLTGILSGKSLKRDA